MELTRCPLCESTAIRKKKGKRTLRLKEQIVTTAVIEFWECASCGEVFYPPKSGKQLDEFCLATAVRRAG